MRFQNEFSDIDTQGKGDDLRDAISKRIQWYRHTLYQRSEKSSFVNFLRIAKVYTPKAVINDNDY